MRKTLVLSSAVIAMSGLLIAQTPQPVPAKGPETSPQIARPAPMSERLSSTSHVLRLDGRDIRYTATAGTLPIRDDRGKTLANMFFVAYTLDGEQAPARPLAFLYNGGPGSATIWLHMGSFGPRRVVMAEDGMQPAPPYRLADNGHSLLDVSDLVFVDAVDTGYSRTVDGEDARQFHGVQGDLRAFGEFIRMYLTRFDRWSSPKYLIGESYGTMRSAGLAGELQDRHGIELNGIVLVSSILDYLTKGYAPGNDLPYVLFLPSYTAAAWYHKRLPADLQGNLEHAVAESRKYANGEYLLALAKGNRLTEAEQKQVAQALARLTGLSAQFILQSNLRVADTRFRVELLRDQRRTIGRLDGRMTGLNADAAAERQEYDPSDLAIKGAYTAMFGDYVRRELKYESDERYATRGEVRPWSYDQFTNSYLNLTDTLRGAMARHPFLKVLVVNGYYDFATPFGATEHTFAHLAFDAAITDRVQMTYYQAGHMMYIRPSEHAKLKQDVARFINATSGRRTGS